MIEEPTSLDPYQSGTEVNTPEKEPAHPHAHVSYTAQYVIFVVNDYLYVFVSQDVLPAVSTPEPGYNDDITDADGYPVISPIRVRSHCC